MNISSSEATKKRMRNKSRSLHNIFKSMIGSHISLLHNSSSESIQHSSSIQGVFHADINVQKLAGVPPQLYKLACASKWDEVVARCKSHPEEAKWQDREGGTTLHAACYLLAPVDVILALLAVDPTTASSQSKQGATPLHIACLRGSCADVIRALVKCCPRTTTMVDAGGGTPLHIACCRYGYGSASLSLLRIIVAANTSAVIQKDDRGRTPLGLVGDEFSNTMKRGLASLSFLEDPASAVLLHPSNTEENNATVSPLAQCWEKMSLLVTAAYQSERSKKKASCDSASNGLNPVNMEASMDFDEESNKKAFLLHACAGVEQCPLSFLQLVIRILPEQLSIRDSNGNLPLHIAAASANIHGVGDEESASDKSKLSDSFALQEIFHAYPAAVKEVGKDGKLPLVMAIEAGRTWLHGGVRVLFLSHPAALVTEDNLDIRLYPPIFSRIGCGQRESGSRKKAKSGQIHRPVRDIQAEESQRDEANRWKLSIMFELITSKPEVLKDSAVPLVVEKPAKYRSKLLKSRESIRRHFR